MDVWEYIYIFWITILRMLPLFRATAIDSRIIDIISSGTNRKIVKSKDRYFFFKYISLILAFLFLIKKNK